MNTRGVFLLMFLFWAAHSLAAQLVHEGLVYSLDSRGRLIVTGNLFDRGSIDLVVPASVNGVRVVAVGDEVIRDYVLVPWGSFIPIESGAASYVDTAARTGWMYVHGRRINPTGLP